MSTPIFTGAGVALVTPFHQDGSVNYNKLKELIEFQIDNKTDAIIIAGTTGEAPTLSDEEHKEVISFAAKVINKRVPLIAGAGSNDTLYGTQNAIFAEKAGADALLLVTPYYNKTTQRGLIEHFNYYADHVNIPIILYNVPGRTGVNIEPDTCAQLAKHKNIVAIKEASGNISQVAEIAAKCPDLDIYSGNDDQIVPVMSLGGKGVISVLSNVAPEDTHNMCQKYLDGDAKGALELQLKYSQLNKALFCEVNPIPVKEALNIMGLGVGPCRMPLCKMDPKNIEFLTNALKGVNII